MSKFGRLKKFTTTGRLYWMEMPELGEKARLQLRPAAESNKPYYNALLRTAGKRQRKIAKHGLSIEDIQNNRAEDRVLFAKYVIADWDGVQDDQGEPVPFSEDNVKELCDQLPDILFDQIRNEAGNLSNFYDDDEQVPDADELAGN
jgi:hypothetical protein